MFVWNCWWHTLTKDILCPLFSLWDLADLNNLYFSTFYFKLLCSHKNYKYTRLGTIFLTHMEVHGHLFWRRSWWKLCLFPMLQWFPVHFCTLIAWIHSLCFEWFRWGSHFRIQFAKLTPIGFIVVNNVWVRV